VRDGKAGPRGPVLEIERDSWSAFVAFAKEFDV